MSQELAHRLRQRITDELPYLYSIPEADAASKPASKWSRKEELGHLIDSASNNHLRFVQGALQPEYRGPGYDQHACVQLHGYQDLSWADVLALWRSYNLLLAELIARIPADKLTTPCIIGDGAPVTLRFVIEDYILHLRHHVDHILRREPFTPWRMTRTLPDS
jgi:hypothetical protein